MTKSKTITHHINQSSILLLGLLSVVALSLASSIPSISAEQQTQSTVHDSKYYIEQFEKAAKHRYQLLGENEALKNQVIILEKAIQTSKTDTVTESLKAKLQQVQKQISVNDDNMNLLIAEMDDIQQKVYKLVEVDSITQQKLDSALGILSNEYLNPDSKTFIPNNPVSFMYPDYEYKKIIVMFDPNKVNDENGSKKQKDVINRINELVGFWPIETKYGVTKVVSCASRTDPCSPVIGGISISQVGQTVSEGSTSGYYSVDSAGNAGFVLPSHASGPEGKTIVQPAASANAAGTVTINPCPDFTLSCDYAFVKANDPPGVANRVFNDGVTEFTITNRVPKSSQTVGTIVQLSGINGIKAGMINGNVSTNPWNIATIPAAHGDSGSPVFTNAADNGINLYGMAYRATSQTDGDTIYFPPDIIKNGLGIQQ